MSEQELLIAPEVLGRLKRRLADGRAQLAAEMERQGVAGGLELCAQTTAWVDEIVSAVAEAALQVLRAGRGAAAASLAARVALVALGSYGRRELCPYSDLDLMFLKPPGLSPEQLGLLEDFVRVTLYGLWDLGFEVGHAVRDAQETLVAAEDQSVLSGLLDARLLPGRGSDSRAHNFEELVAAIRRSLFSGSRAERLISEKIAESDQRRDRFDSSVFLLEPNVKESQGGLRELHTALWIAQARWRAGTVGQLRRLGKLSGQESQTLLRAYASILGVRVELHLAAKRKQDVLRFQYQEVIAQRLGYIAADAQDQDRRRHGTERFMRAYYYQAKTLRHHCGLIVERAVFHRRTNDLGRGQLGRSGFKVWNGTLTVTDADQFRRDPAALIRIFRVAAEAGMEVYSYTKTLISSARRHLDRQARRSPAAVQELLRAMEPPKGPQPPVELLHAHGILQQMIPELSRVTARWQHSLYHVYTVDVHSLMVLSNLHQMAKGSLREAQAGFLHPLVESLQRPQVLYMAALLHDVGKGWPRDDHSVRGARVAQTVGARLEQAGLSRWTAVDTRDLVWLVREHLTMSNISQRRDISDPELVTAAADEVGGVERLTMLYLLTAADMMGTSPTVWTDWKASLLKELYLRVRGALLERGQTSHRQLVQERRERLFGEILTAAEGALGRDEVAAFLATMDLRYLLRTPARRVVRHIGMWRRVSAEGGLKLRVRQQRRAGLTRITVVCPDRTGLLGLLSGTLAASRLQIQAAEVHSVARFGAPQERVALDTVWVSYGPEGGPFNDTARLQRLREDLRRVLVEGQPVESLMQDRLARAGLADAPEPAVKVRVSFSNEESSTETVFDVFGRDRIGALYDICKMFQGAGLSISLAKISTQGHRLADGFYVTDAETGEKVLDEGRLKAVRAQLLEVVDN